MDVKRKRGRLKLDSMRYLQQKGWPETIIDIDTYGSPWKHWRALLPNVARPTTVFLTVGAAQGAGMAQGMKIGHEIRDVLGLGKLKIPSAFGVRLYRFAIPYLLSLANIIEIQESITDANCRHIGARIDVSVIDKGSCNS